MGKSIGKPQRCEPKMDWKYSSGFPESGRIKNIKFVSHSKFKQYTGIAKPTSNIRLLNADFMFISTCRDVTSMSGYITSKICIIKL